MLQGDFHLMYSYTSVILPQAPTYNYTGEVSQICKGLQYVCIQQDDANAQTVCEILDAVASGGEHQMPENISSDGTKDFTTKQSDLRRETSSRKLRTLKSCWQR